MKKRYVVLAALMLSTTFLATACGGVAGGESGGGGSEGVGDEIIAPDYSAYTDQFEFYGYSSASNGKYKRDDIEYFTGESYLTTEHYQLYKDAGMNVFFPQSVFMIYGERGLSTGDDEGMLNMFYESRAEDWEWIQKELDKLESVGITKTILYDQDISWLGLNKNTDQPLVGEGMQFATEDDLDDYVYKLVRLYAEDERVYGIMLADEPKYIALLPYADLYHSIQRVNEKYGYNLYIHFNLNPLNLSRDVYNQYYPAVEGTPMDIKQDAQFAPAFIRYKKYIEDFLDEMQPTSVQYDDYPLRVTGGGAEYVSATYIPCLQYVAGQARDRNIDFRMVTQTYTMYINQKLSTQAFTAEGAKWLNNMIIGFGAKSISYFTYFAKADNKTTGESFPDNGDAFLTRFGKPTKTYEIMQGIMANEQKFAPTVLQFKYQKSGVFRTAICNFSDAHIANVEGVNEQTYEKLTSVSINKEIAMVNELYDAANDRYMYMAMNIVDPKNQGSKAYQTITLEFASEYKYAAVYKDGECKYYRLKDGKLDIKGAPGDASFVIPFN